MFMQESLASARAEHARDISLQQMQYDQRLKLLKVCAVLPPLRDGAACSPLHPLPPPVNVNL